MANRNRRLEVTQEVILGDCIEKMNSISPRSVDLIIADSPYNIGKKYDNYNDRRPHDEFMQWVWQWFHLAIYILQDHGSFFLFAPDEWVSEVDVMCRGKLHRRSWIVWYYTFGVANQTNFSRSHTHILYYTKSKTNFVFNDKAVRVKSARQLVYNDTRQNPKGKLPDNTWILLREQLEPYMTPDQDTWLVSRICGTYKERQKHSSNQIPVEIMERIVLACSEPGDLVLDPFAGTGSSGVACVLHNRNWLGIDISSTCVEESRKRIKRAKRGLE